MSQQCYNRGCGKMFDPETNTEDSCRYHPGAPYFHDAYKGWSCCNKKCIDFTEFLNIKGCTVSKHSNVKPPEPEKPTRESLPDTEVIEVHNEPLKTMAVRLERPKLDSPMIRLEPHIAPGLKEQNFSSDEKNISQQQDVEDAAAAAANIISIGTTCKRSGCNASYEGDSNLHGSCVYHPGVPIFHEGMKFWSCCQKRTSDFTAFLNQAGCETGTHLWQKPVENDGSDRKQIECRWDFHQTAAYVIASIYAKQYCVRTSEVNLNPIRLQAILKFPQEGKNACFILDVELAGIVDVSDSQVSMMGSKVEIKMKKAEPGSWPNLELRNLQNGSVPDKNTDKNCERTNDQTTSMPFIEGIDLDDL